MPHPLCTKCNDQLRPGFKVVNCPECALHEKGPVQEKKPYSFLDQQLADLFQQTPPFKPPWTEEDRFAFRQKYLALVYGAGWTEQEYEDYKG